MSEPIPQEMRAAGLHLHGLGMNVLPIPAGAKGPTYKWKHWHTQRQAVPDARRLMWDGWQHIPAASGVGVVAGVGDVHTFDLDKCRAPSATIDRLLAALGLPLDYAWAEQTGSGTGGHVHVRCPDELPSGALPSKREEPGVFTGLSQDDSFHHLELRWQHCQTVVAPSVHQTSGKRYAWRHGTPTTPPAVVPVDRIIAAFYALAKRPDEPAKAERPARETAQTSGTDEVKEEIRQRFDMVAYAKEAFGGDAQQEQNGEIRILGHGGLLIQPEAEVFYSFLDEVGGDCFDLVGLHLFNGQWTRSDRQMFIKAKEEAARYTGVVIPPPDPTFGLKISSKKSKEPTPPPINWIARGISASDLQARTFSELNWPVANILSEGCTLLAGKPKSKKSWLALGIAIDVARGQPTLGGLETKQGRVVYLDLESNQRRMQSRLRAMLGNNPWPQNLHIFTEWPRGEDAIMQLDEWMILHGDTILVVCDILKNVRADRIKNANPYDEDYESVKPFNAWAERNHAAMLMIHHTRKAKADDVFDEISGSTGLSAGVSSMWVMGRLPNSTESVLAIRGRDIVLDDDMALAWDDYACRHLLTGTAEERSMSQERRDILDAMSDTGEYTPKELATLLNKPVNSIVKLLTHLFSDRMIEKSGRGKYVKVMGRQTYGLVIKSGTTGLMGTTGTTGTTGTREAQPQNNELLVPDRARLCPPETTGGHKGFDASQSGKQAVINGLVPVVPTPLRAHDARALDAPAREGESEVAHDKRREREIDAALLKGDFGAARRAARWIRGNKDRIAADATIAEAEAEAKASRGKRDAT